MSETIRAEIKKLEDKRYQAMCAKDLATLEQLLGDGLVYTHSYGGADTKAQYLDGIKSGKFDYRGVERPEESIQIYGDNTAIVTGHVKISLVSNGQPRQLNSRYINVWNKGARGWQMVAWQSTPLPG